MKHIAIIGGGISGLSVLHFLKQRFKDSANITLYERESAAGGTIRSFKKGSCLFEWGPNGFLDNQPDTLSFIEELKLTGHLIKAQSSSSRRYIQINGKLLKVPGGFIDFVCTPLLPFKDKISLVSGIFKKNITTDTSIHDYVSKRFSVRVAENLADPFISGIYAGNIRRLHMASAFPKLRAKGGKKSQMYSFKGGMGQIIEALSLRYQDSIQVNNEISSAQMDADAVIIATPAYSAAQIVERINPKLTQILNQVPYAPIAVVGAHFKKSAFRKIPDGFGYLIPSSEKKDVLGVLVESNVYQGRAGDDEVMVRVMLGGAHHPAIINDNQEIILSKAMEEIEAVYGLQEKPLEVFVKSWPKAIPQYEINYPHLRRLITEELAKTPGLHLCANYLDGISFNDCVSNAKKSASLLSA